MCVCFFRALRCLKGLWSLSSCTRSNKQIGMNDAWAAMNKSGIALTEEVCVQCCVFDDCPYLGPAEAHWDLPALPFWVSKISVKHIKSVSQALIHS